MTDQEKAAWFLQHPAALGRALGYRDLRDDLHGVWLREMVYGSEDYTLQAHRGSYKTTCLTLAIALLMLKERRKNIIFLRKTDADVSEVIKGVKRILSSDLMQTIFRALTGQALAILHDNSAEITLECYNAPRGASQLLGIGIGGSLTGKHGDIIITDDIVNLKDRISRAERERTKAVYMELQNIRNPGGRIINTGTPWHVEDAFSLMPTATQYDCYTTGLLPPEAIDELKRCMSPSLFAANYELRHIASEHALFTAMPRFFEDPDMIRDGIAHIDAAYGGDDYTAFTCCKRVGDTLLMYGRMWHSHVDSVLDVCISEAKRLMCMPIWCEGNGDKGFLGKEINNKGLKAVVYHETENKYYKISTFLRKWWPNVVWLKGTDPEYLAQITDYTEDAEHDDAPDSAAVMCRYFDKRHGEAYKSPIFQKRG